MKYRIYQTNKFKKNLKLMIKRNLPIDELETVVNRLSNDIPLEEKYYDHELTGNKKGMRECHIKPDWLLIYKKENDILVLTLLATGTHSDLFSK